ncbi:MAG: competence/damage-inducible protein A [Alphaproteobacteria bacterium]|nr:competence/damage-inducible protein A [Alphaproteobacteria bacterium]
MADNKTYTAALLIIGNEILSGRTTDANVPYIAGRLNALGIRLSEVRVVPDVEAEIVDALNALRARYTYVFTTGGIGPTHDDITADCVAKAFGVALVEDAEARRRLEERYAETGIELNEARLRMARAPVGAVLIDNPVSAAPGFQIENVFVMAGVPKIMQAMFESLRERLVGGDPLISRSIASRLPEGMIAQGLGEIQARHQGVDIGSYPSYSSAGFGVAVVLRHTDRAVLNAAARDVIALIRDMGGEPAEQEM